MKVCSKCFETNEPSAEFCSECGAPFKEGSEGSDQEVYKDLARANLLRMRGDMKAANDVCLKILRRYPNNATAHTLLGDISADQADLQQAATWYEMAIDLNPDSPADKVKLASIQERTRLKEAAEAAQQIGIPERGPRIGPFILIVAFTVLAVGVGAFMIGKSGAGRPSNSTTTIDTPISVGEQPKSNPALDNKDADPNNFESHPVDSGTQSPSQSQPDAALLSALQSKGTQKLEYVGMTEDPRGQSATVTVKSVPDEAANITASKAGLDFFAVLPAFKKLTVRVLGESGFVLVADMTEEAAKTAKAAIEGGDTVENQSQVMLSQTWTPPHKVDEGPTGEKKD